MSGEGRQGPVVIEPAAGTDPAGRRGPVLIEAGPALAGPAPSPEAAPPVPDPEALPGTALAQAIEARGRPPGWFGRLAWAAAAALAGMAVSVLAWDFVTGLFARNLWLGRVALGLGILVAAGVLLFVLREIAGLARLRRVDRLRAAADAAHRGGDLAAARRVAAGIGALYGGRSDLAWARSRMAERTEELLDADGLLALAEREYLGPLDARAAAEVEAAARRVAVVTAMVPLALADVAAALVSNIRMIRRIAEIYGGRAGTLGSLRLVRAVAAHLIATGAIAVGDDLIGAVVGGGVLARLSRRFGEGLVNGALTARVGVAAMEVCRPMPFVAAERPQVTALLRRAMAGLIPKV
jgi:putative membrane protein